MAEAKIKITTTADTGGIEATKKAMADLTKGSGKSAAESAGVFGEHAKTQQAAKDNAQALSDMTKEAKENAEVVDKAESAHSRFAAGMKKAGHASQELGVVLDAIKNPWNALAFVIALVIREINRQIEAQNKLAESGAKISAALDPAILATITYKTEAANAAKAAQDHADALANVAREANSLDVALSKNLSAEEREYKVQQATLEVQKQKALHDVKDPQTRAGIELEFATRQRNLRQKFDENKAIKIKEADEAAMQEALHARKLLPAARADYEAKKSKAEQNAKERDALGNKLGTLQAELESAQTNPSEEEDRLAYATFGLLGAHRDYSIRSVDEITTEIQGTQRVLDTFKGRNAADASSVSSAALIVKNLEADSTGHGRFKNMSDEAIADAIAGRKVAGLGNQAGAIGADAAYRDSLVAQVSGGLESGAMRRGTASPPAQWNAAQNLLLQQFDREIASLFSSTYTALSNRMTSLKAQLDAQARDQH